MAQWRKVLVSGSSADVSSLSVGTANGTAGTIVNNSSIAGSRITGSFTGSFVGDGSNLTGVSATGLDIDSFGSDLTSATLAVSDLIIVSDGGTDGRANIGDLATPLAGTGLAASSNTLALDLNELGAANIAQANDSIVFIDADDNSSKKESVADFVDAINGTGIDAGSGQLSVAAAQTNITSVINSSLGKIGTAADQEYLKFDTANEVNVHINNTERLSVTATGVDITGNLTLAGAVSASSGMTGSFTGSFVGDGSGLTGVAQDINTLTELDATPHATQDEFLISDNGTEKRISMTNVANGVFAIASDSGDATIGADGGITINTDSIEGTMLNTNAADTSTIELSSDTLSVLKVPNAVTFSTGLSAGGTFDGAAARTVTVASAQTGIETIYNTSLIIGRAANDTTISFTTDDEIVFDQGSTEAMKIDSTGVTIAGNLTVNGSTTTISSTNLNVEDAFIFAGSGSAGSNVDGGLIVQEGSNEGTGSAIYHDTTDNRWAVAKTVKSADTAVTALEHVVTVKQLGDNDAAVEGDKEYGAGEMAINNDGTIWIYS